MQEIHASSRRGFYLPERVPRSQGGVLCHFCVNECQMSPGESGFCGLRENRNGKIFHIGGTPQKGILDWYYDPLPTNCVADRVCPGGSDAGYPEYSYSEGPEFGFKNLALFYRACTFDCLFCQNWHFREKDRWAEIRERRQEKIGERYTTAEDLKATSKTQKRKGSIESASPNLHLLS
ncbi:MAG: hypothetical protein AB1756_01930 [Acidobacteriota bacterium]